MNPDPGNQWAEKPLSVRLAQIKRQWINLGPQQLLMLDNLILSAEYLEEQLAMKPSAKRQEWLIALAFGMRDGVTLTPSDCAEIHELLGGGK